MAHGHTPPIRDQATTTETDASGNRHTVHHFRSPNQPPHIKVKVPQGKDATPHALDWKDAFVAPGNPIRRKIINLVMRDSGGQAVTRFDPPIHVHVKVDPTDTANTQLWFFNPTTNQWQDLGATRIGDEFVATISNWYDDPAIGGAP